MKIKFKNSLSVTVWISTGLSQLAGALVSLRMNVCEYCALRLKSLAMLVITLKIAGVGVRSERFLANNVLILQAYMVMAVNVISPRGLGGSSDIDAALREEISMRVPDTSELKSRISSTSSTATSDSQGEDGAETPVVQSDDEDAHDDDELLINGTPPANRAGEESEVSL